MNRKDVIQITKILAVESAKGYVQAVAANVLALGLLAGIGYTWMKVDEFRAARKNQK